MAREARCIQKPEANQHLLTYLCSGRILPNIRLDIKHLRVDIFSDTDIVYITPHRGTESKVNGELGVC